MAHALHLHFTGRPRETDALRASSRCAACLLAVVLGVLAWPAPVVAGTIEGQVILTEQRSRLARVAYPTGGVSRRLESLPAVVMLTGRIAGAANASGGTVRVVQRDTTFRPGVVIVPQGATVAFPNEDPFFHNVFSYSRPRRFDLGRYPRGETKSVRFESAGIVKVFCEIHSWMRGAVVVAENPYHTLVDDDGSFRIENVPAGRYRLRAWHFDRGEEVVEVDVPESGTVRLEIRL